MMNRRDAESAEDFKGRERGAELLLSRPVVARDTVSPMEKTKRPDKVALFYRVPAAMATLFSQCHRRG
jgi:hypothetical protein